MSSTSTPTAKTPNKQQTDGNGKNKANGKSNADDNEDEKPDGKGSSPPSSKKKSGAAKKDRSKLRKGKWTVSSGVLQTRMN